MADLRFFDRKGPFTLQEVVAMSGAILVEGVDDTLTYEDIALSLIHI